MKPNVPEPVPGKTEAADVVVVGAGFAGAATALALSASSDLRIVVIDAAPTPAYHASGRNAAMARRVIAEPVLAQLATTSVHHMRERWPHLVDSRGGLLLGDVGAVDRLMAVARNIEGLESTVERWTRARAEQLLPCLQGGHSTDAVFSHACGVVDIHGLLQTYIREARTNGVTFEFGAELVDVERTNGVVSGVRIATATASGLRRLDCSAVVNAAGFAVNRVAHMAGVSPIAATPFRRHLYVTASMPIVEADWPFVWDVSRGFYFRPEGDGLLMCACDGTPWEPPLPDEPTTNPEQRERLAERFSTDVPGLVAARPKRHWAGLRVLTDDGRFAIGSDPELGGLTWVAALGGHGMTTSLAVGQLAARFVLGESVDSATRDSLGLARLR